MRFIIGCLLFSNFLYAIDEKQVLEQLMGIHGANWNSIAKNPSELSEIKIILKNIIQGNIDTTEYGYTGEVTSDITQNAISEYGNFISIDSNGNIEKDDMSIINQIKTSIEGQWSGHDALAYFELLKNTGSAEGLELLSEPLLQTQDLSTLYAIERSIHHGLNGPSNLPTEKNLDNSYIDYFKPHLQKSWKAKSGKWDSALLNINKRLEKAEEIIKGRSQDQRFINTFEKLRTEIKEISKNEENLNQKVFIKDYKQETPKKPNPAQKLATNPEREISGVEDKEENLSSQHYWWGFFIFGFTLAFLIRSVIKR